MSVLFNHLKNLQSYSQVAYSHTQEPTFCFPIDTHIHRNKTAHVCVFLAHAISLS